MPFGGSAAVARIRIASKSSIVSSRSSRSSISPRSPHTPRYPIPKKSADKYKDDNVSDTKSCCCTAQ